MGSQAPRKGGHELHPEIIESWLVETRIKSAKQFLQDVWFMKRPPEWAVQSLELAKKYKEVKEARKD